MNSLLRCAGFLPRISVSRSVGQSVSRSVGQSGWRSFLSGVLIGAMLVAGSPGWVGSWARATTTGGGGAWQEPKSVDTLYGGSGAWEEPQGVDTVFDAGGGMDIGSGLVGNGPAPVEIGVPAELAQNRPPAESVYFETLAPGRSGYLGAKFSVQDKSGNPPREITMYKFRSTFAARLVKTDGQEAFTYGIKSVIILGIAAASGNEVAYGCDWHLVGVAPNASQAADLAQSLVRFVEIMPRENWDAKAMSKEPGFMGSWVLDTTVAKDIVGGLTSGQLPAMHTVSANLEKTTFQFFSGKYYPASASEGSCFNQCMKKELDRIFKAFMSCLGIVEIGGAGGLAACVFGCLATTVGYPACISGCFAAVGIALGVVSAACVLKLALEFEGATLGCLIGCW